MAPDRHLALFVPSMQAGGAERAMLRLANALVARGHRVDLVLASAEGPFLTDVDPRVQVFDLGTTRVAWSLFGLARYLRCHKPNTILSAQTHGNLALLLSRIIAVSPARVVIRVGTTLVPQRGSLLSWLIWLLYRRADAVICNSRAVAEIVQRAGVPRDRTVIVANLVSRSELITQARQPVDCDWLDASESPVIVAVGRLHPAKDYPTLIRALSRVRGSLPARLVILGEGTERPHLEELIERLGLNSAVHLPGFMPNPYPYVARADVFVLSSKREGLPNVLIEALMLGVPTVATDCPTGPREILAGGEYGRLVPVEDDEAMAAAILAALECPPRDFPEESWFRYDVGQVVDDYMNHLFPGDA